MKPDYKRHTVCGVDYSKGTWRYLFVSMLFYVTQPVVMPLMMFISKVLKRPVRFFPVRG